MGNKERKEIYKKIEDRRGNPLIVYVTSGRIGAGYCQGDCVKLPSIKLRREGRL